MRLHRDIIHRIGECVQCLDSSFLLRVQYTSPRVQMFLRKVFPLPYKPKKPCAYPGCHRLTNSRYCEEHAKQEARRYNRYDRDPESNKRYDRKWQKIRAAFLSANPLCELCQLEGRLTPAELVHHKIKITDGGTNKWSNLQTLCQQHHSSLHAKQGDYFN